MIPKALIVFMFLLIFPVIGLSQQVNSTQLEQYKWKNRLVLIFAPSNVNTIYQQQIEALKNKDQELADRDLKIFRLLYNGGSTVDGHKIMKAEVQRLARKYDIGLESFTIILIGKDGTEKLRQSEVLKTTKLFSVIDAMPMRQRQMEQNG